MSHHRKYANKVTEKTQRKYGQKLLEHYPTLGQKLSHSYKGNEYKNGYDPVHGVDKVSSDLEKHKHRKHYA